MRLVTVVTRAFTIIIRVFENKKGVLRPFASSIQNTPPTDLNLEFFLELLSSNGTRTVEFPGDLELPNSMRT